MRTGSASLRILTSVVCASALCAFAASPASAAPAAGESASAAISVRSFPGIDGSRLDLTAEAVSTEVDADADWGGIEELDVPQTKSQAEKQAEQQAEAVRKAEEEARAKASEDAEVTVNAASVGQGASRGADRVELDGVSDGAAASIQAAYGLVGATGMDCTALVSAALAARGIDFHGWPEQYVNVPGGQIVADGSLKPGDILIYAYTIGANAGTGHYDHVALYVGNGQAIHGGWTGGTVALASALLDRLTITVRLP